jgi:hypothetical protein
MIPRPLFVKHITVIQPILTLDDVSYTSKLNGSSSLLMVVRKYVGDSIKKTIDLILEIWELALSSTSFSIRILYQQNCLLFFVTFIFDDGIQCCI